jgi:hypothetical protein
MMVMANINKEIQTRITKTIKVTSLITIIMAGIRTNNTVINKVAMDIMMNREFVIIYMLNGN